MVASTPTGGATKRVLVVDDDARVRRALGVLIESSTGLSVVGGASSAAEALGSDEALAPDVVLLDLLLPLAGDGLEALRALTERGRTVVALSIRASLRGPALAAGAVAFVEKGAPPEELLDALRHAPPSSRRPH